MVRSVGAILAAAWAFAAPAWAGAATAAAPVALVDTFVGTSGTPAGGPIDTFPGADVPFGMVQWSPDTPSQNAGGGYDYGDRDITGFSLTHLSGPGCSVFGDFSVLPTIGAVPADPATAKQPFTHASEETAPGWYAVTLGNPGIRAELTVTRRTGIGRFTFPAAGQANLLFDVSSNQAGVTDASVRVDAPNQISGSASSGFFCGMPDQYTVYFVARFSRPMRSFGTWKHGALSPGSAAANGPGTGAWLTFDTTRDRAIDVKIGLSFVSVAGAIANLNAEQTGWNVIGVRDGATEAWNRLLERIAIAGGTLDQRRIFYTALYHALLHPNVISDVDGLYRGFDGKTHRVAAGRVEYANFSDWDIYRTEMPLLALVAPRESSDMMQSLVDAAEQENGWLPRWALVNGPTSVMGGDSVDPVIAGAYAFGARNFDVRAALHAMVKGASTTTGAPGQGWYVERWELDDDYLRRGYVVNTHTTSVSPEPNGASETLEYALDDFSIARLADALHDTPVYRSFMQRSSNWATLFDTATGWIAPRDADGAFMQTAIGENGQSGFQEGNAPQYTWMVPQDLRDAIAGMGGNAAAIDKLDAFFAQLDAGQDKPLAWLGNEVSLGSPWVYLSAGAPWRTQQIVRDAVATLYADTPAGIPGNDDLGTMSAWYLWCAMGLYPQNPAVGVLDVGSPLFPSITIKSPGGTEIDVRAPQAATAAPYVQRLRVNGRASNATWVALPQHGRLRLDFALGTAPNQRWGSDGGDAPPSYASAPVVFPPATAAALAVPPSQTTLSAGAGATLPFSISNRTGRASTDVTWSADLPAGLHLQPDRGESVVAPGAIARIDPKLSADTSLASGYYNVLLTARAANGAKLEAARAIVRAGSAPAPVLAYAENLFGNSVTPVDAATGAVGPEIAVGEEPRDAVLSADRRLLFVADLGSASVSVVDTAKQTAIASVKVGQQPGGIAIAPGGTTVWVANGGDGTIQPIDVASLKAGAPIAVGSGPRDIAIAPDGATLYVTDSGWNAVTPVDLRTRTVQPAIGVGLRPAGIAIAPDGRTLYVANGASNDVTPIDVAKRRALQPIGVGVDPLTIAISPNGKLAYVGNYATSTITPIDLTTDRAQTPLPVGGAPYGIAFAGGGATALVVVRRDNACVVVDVATGRVAKTIPLGNGPYTITAP